MMSPQMAAVQQQGGQQPGQNPPGNPAADLEQSNQQITQS